jgi:hypothetical protein
MDVDEIVRGVVEWAREKSALHHRMAAENKYLRPEHIAASTAYRDVADELENRARLLEMDHG